MRLSRPFLRWSAAAAATAVLLATGACSTGDDGGPAGGELLGSVETNYGLIEIPKPADGDLKVVALGWSDGEVALSLGVKPVAIYDWQDHGEANKGVGPWATAAFGDSTPALIERGGETLNYEQIQSFDPDVILNARSAFDDQAYARLSQIAPTVFAPKGTPDFALDWRTHTTLIAQALGRVEQGRALIADLDATFARYVGENPTFQGVTTVAGSKFGDAYGANLPGDARFDVYGALGFTLNPPVAALPASGFFAPVSVEQVPTMDADVAVLTTIGYPISAIQQDPLISSLDVVKDGRTVFLDPEGEAMQGATAGTVAGLKVALAAVVPQLQAAVAKLDR
ncbi:ABC transporter substrate-binding protein [Polymorphospora rubra]|uniref:Fe/B12 periplasmic-binding domain-containing protein n=1 Tax=Polymorphospora rubra TaxID=338584 RepID=A0A810N574_9ACTN|nr:ABC transporter substrate-binding protein [Polymorphospora rubra]BCJ68546.1 hypothetical protein Prubr_55670 [Polymorphospora rubra]